MNDALAAVVSQSQSKKVSTSSKARQYKSSAPRTWLEWTPSQKSLCVQLFLEGNYNHIVLRIEFWINGILRDHRSRIPGWIPDLPKQISRKSGTSISA